MSCCSYSNSSVHAVRSFSSSSVVLPRNRDNFSTTSCHWRGGMGYRGLGYFGSRSLDGMVCTKPRKAVGRHSPARRGYGFGALGMRFCCRGVGFGYRVGGVSRLCNITPITINEQLLQPLKLELDPNMQKVKYQEKEQIKTLNNKFASFIDKVRLLEQQNKVLETKWSFLQGQDHCKKTTRPVLEAHISNLKKQLEALRCSRARLETDLKAAQQVLETNKKRYKNERSQQMCSRSEFSVLKKDMDCFFLSNAKLKTKVESLKEEVEFLRTFYKEEIHQLQAQISDTSVVVQMDNSQDVNFDGIIADVKAQYKDIVRRSWAEVQVWYESKFEELRVAAGRNADSLRETKTKIAELTRMVQRRNGEVRSAQEQRCKMEAAVADAERRGKTAMEDAKHKLSELDTALQQTKADLAQQLHKYQELTNIKLALDMEIITYRKLLEGEESRLQAEGDFPVSISACCSRRCPTYGLELDFGEAHVSATRNARRTSSAAFCSSAVRCSDGVSSRSTRRSHGEVMSMTKSARNKM